MTQPPETTEPAPPAAGPEFPQPDPSQLPPPPETTVPELPPGCREETDDSGFHRVICDREQQQCPQPPPDAERQCTEHKGEWVTQSEGGCSRWFCKTGKREGPGFFSKREREACAQKQEIDRQMDKCGQSRGRGHVTFENGCPVAVCDYSEDKCPRRSPAEDRQAAETCGKNGMRPNEDFDGQGCRIITCVQGQNFCQQEIAPKAYEECSRKGGELIVKKDEQGCIRFKQCARSVDSSEVEYAEVNREFDSAELLQLALKIDALSVMFDGLSLKIGDLEASYASQGQDFYA